MDSLRGVLGNCISLSLRFGQAFFAVASLLFMCYGIEFDRYTSYWLLVTVMGLVVPWSCALSVVDIFSIVLGRPIRPPHLLPFVVVGNWVFAYLALASGCSTSTLAGLLMSSSYSYCTGELCKRYQMAAVMAFIEWFLLFSSALLNIWILPYT